ncbi:hypothetical protein [Microbulbifer discodermiae]|uniref:hypothetical protein n=1 Tax=Microbulbifer sp. 2201CG32-9 TaxID=3232309 RepID=UPI00345BD0F8
MKEVEFEYGPVSRGMFHALIALTILVPFIWLDKFLYYLGFLFFLGFGLRSFLRVTGLYRMWTSLECKISDKWHKGLVEKRREEVERRVRNDKYRHIRRKDPRLPKDW